MTDKKKLHVEIGEGGALRPDEIEITVTMRGGPTQVMNALIQGLPVEALQQLAIGIADAATERGIDLGKTAHERAVADLRAGGKSSE